MRLDAVVSFALANGLDPDKATDEFYARLNAPLEPTGDSTLSQLLGVA